MSEIVIPAPLPHQQEVLEADYRFKVWRAGRRTGKTRAGFIAAMVGHGPSFKGALTGGHIIWLTPDFPQSRAIWREEIVPRLAGIPGVTLNETEKRVSVRGLGSLEIRSAESIDSVRGRRLDGAVVDEAAYLDLQYALNAVLYPALTDKRGWLLINSTPSAGWDGNAERMTPSYFNRLCTALDAGAMGGGLGNWKAWHHPTEANTSLDPADIAMLRAQYPPGSAVAQQELDAALNASGAMFYPEFANQGKWFVARTELPTALPNWWTYWAGYDWGYAHPAAFVPVCDSGRILYVLDCLYLHREQDHAQADTIRQQMVSRGGQIPDRAMQRVYAGHDAFARRQAHVTMPETVADVFNSYSVNLEKASLDREAGAQVIRRLLAEDRIRFVDTVGNRRLVQEFASLVPDPKRPNVPLKRDANERGENGDDGQDACRYALASAPILVRPPEPPIPGLMVGKDALQLEQLVTDREIVGGILL